MKKIGELKRLLEDSSRKESRRNYENRKVSEGKFNRKEDIKDGTFIIPDGVTKIGTGAFYGCTGLRNISLPKNVKLDNYVFAGCSTDLQIEYR